LEEDHDVIHPKSFTSSPQLGTAALHDTRSRETHHSHHPNCCSKVGDAETPENLLIALRLSPRK
jgi:hypothetical protein